MTLPSSAPAHSQDPIVAHADLGALPNLLKQGLSTAGRSPALPRSRRDQKRMRYVVSTAAIVVVICVTGVGYLFHGAHARANLVTARVQYKDLQFKVVERGSLEARENHDIKCEVKAGSRGAGKIKSVVDNGALVHKGDLLVEIDDSYLQEQALAKKIDRQKALADKIAAEELYPVKKIGVALAKRLLEQWIKGDFPQQLHELEGDIEVNESAVLQQEDRTSWAGRMVKKGYMTASQLEAEHANLTASKLTLQKFREQKKVLIEYTDPVQRQTLRNAIKQAEVDERTAYANMQSTDAIFKQQDHFYQDLVAQIALCKVKSPCDGIVVYAVPEQTRRGAGSSPSIIAQGEPVQAGQRMMSIPDLSHMLLKVNIHEAFINRLKPGLPVKVRVDALPDRALTAKVKYLANVAAPTDWMSPDVKVYESLVEIDDYPSDLKLKPGLSAVCTIFTERHADHVLAVPVQAVLDPLEKGGRSHCYVATSEGGAQMREIELGMSDDKYMEVKSGLNEGDEIILNPMVLESEKGKTSGPIGDVPAASR